MNYLAKSVEAIGQIIGAFMGVGFTTPMETVLKKNAYFGIF